MTGKEYNNQFSQEELENEIWKDVPDFEGYYQVSSLGRVKSLYRYSLFYKTMKSGKNFLIKRFSKEKILCPCCSDGDSRFFINLSKGGKEKLKRIHQLVAIVFLGDFYKDGLEICHNDGNNQNNRLINLRWDTHINNCEDMAKHGTILRGSRVNGSKLTEQQVIEIRQLHGQNYSNKEIAEIFKHSRRNINDIVLKRSWAWLE